MRVQRARATPVAKHKSSSTAKRARAKPIAMRDLLQGGRISDGARGMRQLAGALRLLSNRRPSSGATGMRQLAGALSRVDAGPSRGAVGMRQLAAALQKLA